MTPQNGGCAMTRCDDQKWRDLTGEAWLLVRNGREPDQHHRGKRKDQRPLSSAKSTDRHSGAQKRESDRRVPEPVSDGLDIPPRRLGPVKTSGLITGDVVGRRLNETVKWCAVGKDVQQTLNCTTGEKSADEAGEASATVAEQYPESKRHNERERLIARHAAQPQSNAHRQAGSGGWLSANSNERCQKYAKCSWDLREW